MPRYFFDVYDGAAAVRDPQGIDLDSIEEAVEQAAALLPDLARDAPPNGEARDFAALVRDESESVVYRAALLYRGQRTPPDSRRPLPSPAVLDDAILRSQEARAAAEEVSTRLRASVSDLLAILETSFSTVAEMKDERGMTR